MILADTSAWIEFDRQTRSAVDERLTQLLSRDDALVVTEPVIMEVLMGARTDVREQALLRLLRSVPQVSCDPSSDFVAAARLYRLCRQRGVTPRGPIDCLIVAIAARSNSALLTTDRDLTRMAEVIGLRLDPASTA